MRKGVVWAVQAFLIVFSFSAMAVYEIPQSGQSVSYYANDDGDLKLGRQPTGTRFVDNNDGTLTDNLTGLMWIKDAYCANHFISGATSNRWEKSFEFTEALNNKTLIEPCENYQWQYSDWRVPSIRELQSLFHHGMVNSAGSNLTWLTSPGSKSSGFIDAPLAVIPIWSATTDAADINKAWQIDLDSGEINSADKSGAEFGFIFSPVRRTTTDGLLATGQRESFHSYDDGDIQNGYPIPHNRFIDLEDGTILDRLSGLNWLNNAACATPTGANWQAALNTVTSSLLDPLFFANCPDYNKAEKDKDWRIPNIKELQSLIDFNNTNPALSETHPFNLLLDLPVWSSTSSNTLAENQAWGILLHNGTVNPSISKSNLGYAWPVRGPIEFADIHTNIDEITFNAEFLNADAVEDFFEITNSGTDTLEIIDILAYQPGSDNQSPHFSFGRDGCVDRNLDPDTTCTVTLRFHPRSTGNLSAEIQITSNAPGIEQLRISISGRGLQASENDSDTRCFIATAAFGSYVEPEVAILRNFRDNTLMSNIIGRWFVSNYYHYSPAVAEYIQDKPSLRLTVRLILLPIIYSIKYPLLALLASFLLIVYLVNHYARNSRLNIG